MKKLHVLNLVFALIIFSQRAFSQDLIFKIDNDLQSITCKNLLISNDHLIFDDPNVNNKDSIPLHKLNAINFLEDQSYEVIVFDWILDTIACRIDAIGREEVFYTDQNQVKRSLSKTQVYFVTFGDYSPHPRVNEFWQKISTNPALTAGNKVGKIKTNNGNSFEVAELLSFEDEYVRFKMSSQDNTFETKTKIEQIEKYIHQEIKMDRFYRAEKDYSYVLSKEGNLSQVKVDQIKNSKIQFSKNQNGEKNDLTANKEQFVGLFFGDFESVNNFFFEDEGKKGRKLIDFNLNPFYGYMFGRSMADTLGQESWKNIEDQLRNSFGISLNMNIFFSDLHGIGVTYKYFGTKGSGSIETFEIPGGLFVNEFEEQQKLSYYGLNYIYSLRVNEKFLVDFTFGGGLVDFTVENIFNGRYSITGTSRTSAIHLTHRWTLARKDYYGMYLELSILFGRLKELKLDSRDFVFTDDTMELDKDDPSDFSRIEIGLGFKL